MCTLSFLPNKDGYLVAMNRDEMKTRATALAPSAHHANSLSFLFPQEPSGGTWIAANSRGNLLALMNANAPDNGALPSKLISRGEIIPALLHEHTPQPMEQALNALLQPGLYPFRLFAIFPATREIFQWTWNGARLTSRPHEWIRNHWFSSSRSDSRAETERGRACEMSWHPDTPDALAWLRSLHSSHIPDAGAFSLCVHREDAATVSYTEVESSDRELRMSYLSGNPCEFAGALAGISIPLHP